jgi:hypothetical protein
MAMFDRKHRDLQQIAEALPKCKTVAEYVNLLAELQLFREANAKRLVEFGGSRPGHEGPARLAALAKGPDAALAIQQEYERREFERQFSDRLQMLIEHGRAEAEAAEAGRQIPGAVKRLTSELEGVRKALATLDAAIERVNSTVDVIGRFESAGLPYPLTDDQVRALIAVREEAWRVRHVRILTPQRAQGADDYWLAKWPEVFDLSRLAAEGRWSLRAGPTPAPAPVKFDPATDRPRRRESAFVETSRFS